MLRCRLIEQRAQRQMALALLNWEIGLDRIGLFFEGDRFMKRSNFVFTGLAAVLALGVLTNCSDRMGQFKNHKDLRLDTCIKYNQWARKMNKPEICQNNTLGRPQARPTTGSDNQPVTPVQQDPLLGGGNDPRQPSTPPATPPATPPTRPAPGDISGGDVPPAPPSTPPTVPPGPPVPGDVSGGDVPPTAPPTTPPSVPPAQPPQQGRPGAGEKVSREKFMQVFERQLGNQNSGAKDFVKGITVSSGVEGSDVKLAIEAVIALKKDDGSFENKALVLKRSKVTPFASADITYLQDVVVKKDALEATAAEDTGSKVLVLAACNEANCKQINLIMQFANGIVNNRQSFVFAVCSIEAGRGIKACNFEVKAFADVQTLLTGTGLPTQVVGDVSGSRPGSGNVSVTTGPAQPAPAQPAPDTGVAANQQILDAAKVAKNTVVEQAAIVEAKLAEINQAKTANDKAKAEAALALLQTAAKLADDTQKMISQMVDDIGAQPEATAQQLEEIGAVGGEALAKNNAAQALRAQAEQIVAGMASASPAAPAAPIAAPGDVSGSNVTGAADEEEPPLP